MAGSQIVVIGGVRYRRDDAAALGLLDGSEPAASPRALSLTGHDANIDDIVEQRVAAHIAELDKAAEDELTERRAKLDSEFEERLDAAIDAALAEAAAEGNESDDSSEEKADKPKPGGRGRRGAKTEETA